MIYSSHAPSHTSQHPQRDPQHRHRSGFTLIELLGILAILGLGAVFSLDFLRHSLPKTRVENAALSLQALLYQARLTAVRRAMTVAVRFEPADQRAVAYFLDTGAELRAIDFRLDTGTRYVLIEGPDEEPAIQGLTNLGAGEVGAVFDRGGMLRDPGGIRLVYTGFADYLEVRATTKSGVIEVLKYLEPDDSPTGVAGFFPKATHPVTGIGLWVWYGEES